MSAALFSIAGIGFLVGFRHAFEPDHLAAVATLATREGGLVRAARLGLAWGTGHTASVALVALLLVVLGIHVPETFFRTSEFVVALLLVLLGAATLRGELRRHRAALGSAHAHAHVHGMTHEHPGNTRTTGGSFAFGLAHGLAGSGAVIVLLVASATGAGARLGYLAAFSIGTIVGMSIVSALTGLAGEAAAARGRDWTRRVRVSAALASAVSGIVLGWGVVSG